MKKIILLFILISINITAQNTNRESWSIGVGLSNFTMHGDLRSLETGESNNESGLINLGGYAYIDKMLTKSFGFEAKLHYSKMSGTGQEVSGFLLNNVPLSKTRFEGNSFGGEFNTIINFSTLSSNNENRKWNYSGLFGVGLHRYDSKLYSLDTNELLADYGDGPSKDGKTGSLYFTSSLAVKYKISKKIDLELRQSVNVNEDDHLDAASSNKQNLDFFFKTNLGIVIKLNDKEHDNLIWQDNNYQTKIDEKLYQDMIDSALKDSDGDGVIDRFDLEKNTPKGVVVYGNGVAIDSDKDGVPDYKDKCPLEFFKTKTGCKVVIIDSDKDGIPDHKDNCPNIYAKTTNGCPKKIDSDGDNVPDSKDKCPTVYAKNADGCPRSMASDRDKDGVPDKKDKCPLTYGKTKSGCPKKTKSDERREQIIKNVNKKNVIHSSIELNNSVNINDVDTSPIYPGCKNKPTKFDKTNCIISKISEYIVNNYNTSKGGRIKDKIRVLFIVNPDGTTKVIEVLGKYNKETKDEIKRIFKTLPKIKPGLLKGLVVPVKYSLLFVLE